MSILLLACTRPGDGLESSSECAFPSFEPFPMALDPHHLDDVLLTSQLVDELARDVQYELKDQLEPPSLSVDWSGGKDEHCDMFIGPKGDSLFYFLSDERRFPR